MDTMCDHMTLFPWRRQQKRARNDEFVPNASSYPCKLSKRGAECRIPAAAKWPLASEQDGFVLRSSPDPVLTCVLASSGFYRSTAAAAAVIRRLYRRLVAAYDLYRGNIQSAGPLPSLFTNDETIKTGSHISSQRLYFFEKLRLSAGDGWGFKVTAVFYDCY